MSDENWQLEAIHEQFDVVEKHPNPKKIPSNDLSSVRVTVKDVIGNYLNMNSQCNVNQLHISCDIMKHTNGKEFDLSFVVIVTDIRAEPRLCKMPIFVILAAGKTIFIDTNLTVFNSWEAFLNTNDLPACQFCFPVGGKYNLGRKLKIDFAKSPAAIRQNVRFYWKCLGFGVAVAIVVASFFFNIPPINHKKCDSLLGIANDFVPGIREYGQIILQVVTVIMRLRSGTIDLLEALPSIWRVMRMIRDNFGEEISLVFKKVQTALRKLYDWIKRKFSSFFETASEDSVHSFMAVTMREDTYITTVDKETEEILEASLRNNSKESTSVSVSATSTQVNSENDLQYVDSIFRDAKTESALHSGKKNEDNEIHYITSDLLSISSSIAESLGKKTLNEAQDIFEAISSIVREEFKNKIQTYTTMLAAAKAGAGHAIDIEAFNKSLGIDGNVKEHYWKEAIKSTMETRIAYHIKEKIEALKKEKKILVLEVWKMTKEDVAGLYRFVGINGSGKVTANDLVNALKEIQVNLNEEMLVINETSTLIMIRSDELTIIAQQELNDENTSAGMVYINRLEV